MDKKELIDYLKPAKSKWLVCFIAGAIWLAVTVLLIVFGHPFISMIPSIIAVVCFAIPVMGFIKVKNAADIVIGTKKQNLMVKNDFAVGTRIACADGSEILMGPNYFYTKNVGKIRIYSNIKAVYSDKLKNGNYQITIITPLRGIDYPEKLCVLSSSSHGQDYEKIKNIMKKANPNTYIADSYEQYMNHRGK